MKEEYENISKILGNKLKGQKPVVDKLKIKDYNPIDVAPPFKRVMVGDEEVCYDDEKHLYFVNKPYRLPLISVTTFIGLFESYFDLVSSSIRCAEKPDYNCNYLDKEFWPLLSVPVRSKRIRDAWEKNKNIATSYGSAAHAGQEYIAKHPMVSNAKVMRYLKGGVWGEQAVRKTIVSQLKQGRELIRSYRERGYEVIAEPVLADISLGMAGQADLVLVNHETKDIIILDYKTNAVAPDEKPSFNNMEGLLSMFPDNPMTHYSLQQTIYSMFLKNMFPGYSVSYVALVWIHPETGQFRQIPIDIDFWSGVVRDIFRGMKENNVLDKAYKIMNS